MDSAEASGIEFRNDVQGLRALAVLAVLVFHYNSALLPGGFVGVDVFLVISGYLITSILIRKKNAGLESLVILPAIPGEHCLWVKEKELYGKQGQNLIE